MVKIFDLKRELDIVFSLKRHENLLKKTESKIDSYNLLNFEDMLDVKEDLQAVNLGSVGAKYYLENPDILRKDVYGSDILGLFFRFYHNRTGRKSLKAAVGKPAWDEKIQEIFEAATNNYENLLNIADKLSYNGLIKTDDGLEELFEINTTKNPKNNEESAINYLQEAINLYQKIHQNLDERLILKQKFDCYWKEPVITSKKELEKLLNETIEYMAGRILFIHGDANAFVNGVRDMYDLPSKAKKYLDPVLERLEDKGVIEANGKNNYSIKMSFKKAYDEVFDATLKIVGTDTFDEEKMNHKRIVPFKPGL